MSKPASESVISQWAKTRRFNTAGPLFWAIIAQVCLLLGTIFVVVFVPKQKEEPEFVSHKTIYLPQKELDHRIAQAAFEQVASPPMMMDRIQSQSMAQHALPDLPSLPETAFNPMATTDMVSPSASLFGASGMAGIAGELGGQVSSVSFFGIKDSGRRVVIAFDVSKSVLTKAEKSGVSVDKIKEETKRLIEGLSANTSFAVVQFIRRYEFFQPQLISGTVGNKQKATEWVNREFHTSGYSPSQWSRIEDSDGKPELDGIQAVMRTVFEWEPDIIFIISDGGFGRNYPSKMSRIDLGELDKDISRWQRDLPDKARIHFIGFEMKEDRESEVKKIVRKWKGQFRTF